MSCNQDLRLQKKLTPMNIFSLALGSIIGWGCFVMPGNLFLKTAGPLGTTIGILVGVLIMIVVAGNYGYMLKNFPISGGEFTFAFEGFGRNHAFVCAWFLGLSYISIVPLNATALGLVGRYLLPGLLQRGYLYTIAGFEVYLGEIFIAYLALSIFSFLSIRSVSVSGLIQNIVVFGLIGSVIIIGIAVFISPSVSVNNLLPLFSPSTLPIKGVLSIVAIAPWAFVGFDCIPQAVEEFNFSPKKTFGIMTLSIIFGGIMYILVNTITAIVFPWNTFISSNPTWATGMAVEHILGKVGLFILGISLLAAIFSGMMGFYMASSRLLFSMARAKALPSWFSYLAPKYKTPSNAILFVLLISLITPWFGRQVLNWIVDMASIGAAIGYFYTCASAYKQIKKKNESKLLKLNSLIGIILSICFVFLLLIPGMPAFLSKPSRIILFIWIAMGVLFYLAKGKEYRLIPNQELKKLISGLDTK